MIIVLRSTFDLGHNPNNLPLALAQMYLPYTCTEYYHLHKWLCIYVSNTCAYTYDLIISQSCNSVVVNSGWLGFKHNSLSALLILNLMLTMCFFIKHTGLVDLYDFCWIISGACSGSFIAWANYYLIIEFLLLVALSCINNF